MPRNLFVAVLLALLSHAVTAQDLFAFDEITDHEYDTNQELKSDETAVRCRLCGAPVAYKKCVMSCGLWSFLAVFDPFFCNFLVTLPISTTRPKP